MHSGVWSGIDLTGFLFPVCEGTAFQRRRARMYKQEENLKQRRIFNSVEKSLDGVPKIRS